jgi:hypothetical protein
MSKDYSHFFIADLTTPSKFQLSPVFICVCMYIPIAYIRIGLTPTVFLTPELKQLSLPFRRFLRESLKMANAEDLNRLTSCSLVLLGHIFLSLGNSRESMNMVTPAMQLASKIPDVHVQLWASAVLKGTTPSIGTFTF